MVIILFMKMKTSYLFKQSNYLIFRTAIAREQKQFIKIAFAVHLSAVISAERYRSDSGALKSAVLNFVFFILIKNKIEQSACQSCLKNNLLEVFPLTVGSGKTMAFENRWSRYKEIDKKVPQAYRVYVEDTFLPCDAGDARIFSKEHEHGLRVSKHIFVGNSRLVTAMTHADNNGDTTEQTEKRYYYHADHLQSAQFITNAKGEQYEHIEYTPYGELWIEETAPGIDKLPFRFTGKELDEETGLYYYGARYLDPKYSRWLSGDPALNDYIPKAGADTSKLPNGGAYNCFNFAVFGYGNNNPIKYNDPTGETASYSIDDENKTITINVEIIIFGKDATSEIAQIYEKGIMDAWGGEWTANYNGEEYKVSINANVKLGKRPNIFQKIWNFFFGTKNYVNVENRERAYVVFGFYGNWRAVGRGTRTLSQDNPAGHEFGHLLGFDDRYDYNTQNPKPGWEGNIMAEATYKPSIVEQRDINRMVDYISNQKIFGYQRKHGNIRPWRMLY